MSYDEYFPKDFLIAEDLQRAPKVLTISRIGPEEVGQDKTRKPVARFEEIAQGLVINKTNADALTLMFGPEEHDAIGGQVELFAERVMFNGKLVGAIRLRRPSRSDELPGGGEPSRRPSPAATDEPPDNDAPPHQAIPEGPDGNDLLY
jgi:hypothetical protein